MCILDPLEAGGCHFKTRLFLVLFIRIGLVGTSGGHPRVEKLVGSDGEPFKFSDIAHTLQKWKKKETYL